MDEDQTAFGVFLSERIAARRQSITAEWVGVLEARLDADRGAVFPADTLMRRMPGILEWVAAYVRDSERDLMESPVVDDLKRLAELRRRQGFGIQVVLREYRILEGLVQDESESAALEFEGPSEPVHVVRALGRLKDATQFISAVTAQSYRVWEGRYTREGRDQIEAYGRVLAHELGNRLGAAETAVLLLLSGMEIPPAKQTHLLTLTLESIRRGLQTVADVETLAQPLSSVSSSASIGLPLLVKEALQLAQATAVASGIRVARLGDVPDVRVSGPPLRVALSNLLANALKYHNSEGNRWVHLTTTADDDVVQIVVEDNGPGIPEEDRERVFHQWFQGDDAEDGSGLGLAITRDAIERIDGTVELSEGDEGGARFTVRVPATRPVVQPPPIDGGVGAP